jgi:hypothetical protein
MSSQTGSSIRPVILCISILLVGVALAGWLSRRLIGGDFGYALDDAYIHMAIAKNLVLHGVWGVNADAFASASSGPLWTAILALAFWLGGVRDWMPLALNVLAAVGSVALLVHLHRRTGSPEWFTLFVGIGFVASVPLVVLVWIGMEHSLHVLLTLAAVALCVDEVMAARQRSTRAALLGVLAALMVGARYEGLFVVSACGLVAFRARRWKVATALGLGGALPVLVTGWWNLANGWFFLPASIVMKRMTLQNPGEFSAWWRTAWGTLTSPDVPGALVMLVCVAVVILIVKRSAPTGRGEREMLLIFLLSTVQHLLLARFGWFFRYEAYLVALGVTSVSLAVSPMLRDSTKWRRLALTHDELALGFSLVCFVALVPRAAVANSFLPTATRNIYEQQRQVARFVAQEYEAERIVLNDIGAVTYYADVRTLDLVGLSSLDIARLRIDRRLSATSIQDVIDRDGAEVAIIYESWFAGDLAFFRGWTRVATWSIRDNVVCDDDTVSFFARTTDVGATLKQRLERFRGVLPPAVAVTMD